MSVCDVLGNLSDLQLDQIAPAFSHCIVPVWQVDIVIVVLFRSAHTEWNRYQASFEQF